MLLWTLRHTLQVLGLTGLSEVDMWSGRAAISPQSNAPALGGFRGSKGLATGANGERGGFGSGQNLRLLFEEAQFSVFVHF